MFLLFPISLFSQTQVTGNQSGIWIAANSPYHVIGDITVPNASILTIEAGVTVEFQGGYEIAVQGRLLAVGTEMDSIVFTIDDTTGFSNQNDPNGGWHGLRFIDIPVTNDSSIIKYCQFEYGKAIGYSPASAGSGGSIYVGHFSKLHISNSTICNSMAFSGGGIAFEDSAGGYLVNCNIYNNTGTLTGGGIYCVSGSNPVIDSCDIQWNYGSSGGGIACWYGASPVIRNIKVMNNSAYIHAGGIQCNFHANPSIENVLITNNTATYGAGVNCGNGSDPTFFRVLIADNHAVTSAGGISCGNNSNPDLINVTVSNNTAGYWGGAFYCYDSHPRLVNSILWNNSPEEIYFSDYTGYSNSIMIAYSDIDSGQNGIVTNNNATIFWQAGNINSDPMFTDTTTGDYTLQPGSPCIDSGIQSVLIYYNNNQNSIFVPAMTYNGAAPDMGAFESAITSADETPSQSPDRFILKQNYPNPFNPSTSIEFSIPISEFVTLKVYNILGQEVANLVSNKLTPGNYKYIWDASGFASGIYYYKLFTDNGFVQTRKLILMK